MSPKIDVSIFLYDPKAQKAEMRKFLRDLTVSGVEISEIIPSNIWRVQVDFKYKREWKLFCEKYWGKKYFDEHINKRKIG